MDQLSTVEDLALKIDREASILLQERLKKLENNVERQGELTRKAFINAQEHQKILSQDEMARFTVLMVNTFHSLISNDNLTTRSNTTSMFLTIVLELRVYLCLGAKTLRRLDEEHLSSALKYPKSTDGIGILARKVENMLIRDSH